MDTKHLEAQEKTCSYCGDTYYVLCDCMQSEYEEEEHLCDFGGDAGFCMITSAELELKDLEKHPLHFIRKRFDKKYRSKLEQLYQYSALRAIEKCSFLCPLRPRKSEEEST